jgi:hypothetical protein
VLSGIVAGYLLPFSRMANEMKCDHRGCRCEDAPVERGNESFCSEMCAEMEMSATPEPLCQCGHADCAA